MGTEQLSDKTVRQASELPGPRGLPLFGNLFQLTPRKLHLQLEDWARLHGPIYAFRLGPRRILVVSDMALILQILRERPKGFQRLGAMRDVLEELRATGIVTAEGDDWSRQRRLVMSAFGANTLRAAHDGIARITARLERLWQSAAERGGPLDILHDLTRYTIDVTSLVGFGIDMNTVEHGSHELRKHLELVMQAINHRVLMPLPYWRYIKLPADRAIDRAMAEVERVVIGIIRQSRAAIAADPERSAAPRNLLEAMLAARDAEDAGAGLSDREIFGNVFTVLVAGEDTTANSLAWMLYAMAKDSDVQTRMQTEADTVLGTSVVPERPDDVQKLRYIAAVAQETFRIKSAAPVIFLETLTDMTLADVSVPARTPVLLLTRLVGLKNEHFQDAAAFEPSRWLNPVAAGTKHDARAALTFGAGPRVCPGRALAFIECGMIGSMVARSFDVSLWNPNEPVRECLDFLMKPDNLRLRLRPRRRA